MVWVRRAGITKIRMFFLNIIWITKMNRLTRMATPTRINTSILMIAMVILFIITMTRMIKLSESPLTTMITRIVIRILLCLALTKHLAIIALVTIVISIVPNMFTLTTMVTLSNYNRRRALDWVYEFLNF